MPLSRQIIDKGIVISVSHVVEILDAHDLGDFLRLCELPSE